MGNSNKRLMNICNDIFFYFPLLSQIISNLFVELTDVRIKQNNGYHLKGKKDWNIEKCLFISVH